VIRENIAPCRYLDSDALVPYLPRGPDSIHPSLKGREIWADAVLDWLSRERDPEGQAPWQFKCSRRSARGLAQATTKALGASASSRLPSVRDARNEIPNFSGKASSRSAFAAENPG
jgi:hypothetical protein